MQIYMHVHSHHTKINKINIYIIYIFCRVWSVRFNHFHDQLVLTASSDSRVVLNSVPSLSSEPYGKLVDDIDDEEGDGDLENNISSTRYQLPIQIIQSHFQNLRKKFAMLNVSRAFSNGAESLIPWR